jgi:hypothetical protein
MADAGPRIEYIEARRVLLDALTALTPHLDALVLVGAQAVYLRTSGRIETYQPFTTDADADVVLDPGLLGPIPPLGQAMEAAGFEGRTAIGAPPRRTRQGNGPQEPRPRGRRRRQLPDRARLARGL